MAQPACIVTWMGKRYVQVLPLGRSFNTHTITVRYFMMQLLSDIVLATILFILSPQTQTNTDRVYTVFYDDIVPVYGQSST